MKAMKVFVFSIQMGPGRPITEMISVNEPKSRHPMQVGDTICIDSSELDGDLAKEFARIKSAAEAARIAEAEEANKAAEAAEKAAAKIEHYNRVFKKVTELQVRNGIVRDGDIIITRDKWGFCHRELVSIIDGTLHFSRRCPSMDDAENAWVLRPGVTLEGLNLNGSKVLEGLDLRGCTFIKCLTEGTSFLGAKMEGVTFI